MRKILTLDRVTSAADVKRNLKKIEDAINRLALPTQASSSTTASTTGAPSVSGGLVSVGPQGPPGVDGAPGPQGPPGPGGLNPRDLFTFSTSTLASGATEALSIPFGKTAQLLAIIVDTVSRVRFYSSAAAQAADLSRGLGYLPDPGKGVLAEFAFGSPYQIECAPRPSLSNTEPPVAGPTLYYAITNRSLVSTSVGVSLLRVPQES